MLERRGRKRKRGKGGGEFLCSVHRGWLRRNFLSSGGLEEMYSYSDVRTYVVRGRVSNDVT